MARPLGLAPRQLKAQELAVDRADGVFSALMSLHFNKPLFVGGLLTPRAGVARCGE